MLQKRTRHTLSTHCQVMALESKVDMGVWGYANKAWESGLLLEMGEGSRSAWRDVHLR